MKDIDGYVTKDNLYRLISQISRSADFVVDDMTCSIIVRAISDMPKEDVQPIKHGRWIDHEPFERKNCNVCIECSVCNTWFGHDCIPKTKFCPNCGADMRGEQNEDN